MKITKEKPAHTPGPWKICMHMESDDLVVRSDDIYQDIVANCQCDSYSLTNQVGAAAEREANARLIAAAPEMLEALRAVLPVLEGLAKERHVMAGEARRGEHRDKLHTAIAKAEGGAA